MPSTMALHARRLRRLRLAPRVPEIRSSQCGNAGRLMVYSGCFEHGTMRRSMGALYSESLAVPKRIARSPQGLFNTRGLLAGSWLNWGLDARPLEVSPNCPHNCSTCRSRLLVTGITAVMKGRSRWSWPRSRWSWPGCSWFGK